MPTHAAKVILLAAVGLVAASGPAWAEPTPLVLAIGSNEGLSSEEPLTYAEQDARAFIDSLKRRGDAADTWLLLGDDIMNLSATIDAMIARARQLSTDDVVVYFYYSGHADESDLHVNGVRINMIDLEARLGEIPAGLRIHLLDACRSRGDVALKGGFSRTVGFAIDLETPERLEGVERLHSSSPVDA